MLPLVLGISPIVSAGVVLWARSRATRLEIVDLRHLAPASKRGRRSQTVDAVVLHQMGFSRGSDLQRYLNVTAHFVIMPDGAVGQLHPLSARLPASNGFNGRSVAVEFAGNFPASNGKWWRPETYGRDQLTKPQVAAGRRLLLHLSSLGVRFVFAHRQSSESRGNCPGPDIWRTVGLWAVEQLRMSDGGPGYRVGSGLPILDEWQA